MGRVHSVTHWRPGSRTHAPTGVYSSPRRSAREYVGADVAVEVVDQALTPVGRALLGVLPRAEHVPVGPEHVRVLAEAAVTVQELGCAVSRLPQPRKVGLNDSSALGDRIIDRRVAAVLVPVVRIVGVEVVGDADRDRADCMGFDFRRAIQRSTSTQIIARTCMIIRRTGPARGRTIRSSQEAAMQLDTALYYTFSTIAQALAAAMALLAAFAMYQLKAIDDECHKAALIIEGDTGGGITIRQFAAGSRWLEVLTEARRRIEKTPGFAQVASELVKRIELLLKVHRSILRALWTALAITAIAMAGSVWVLAVVPVMSADAACLALKVGVAAFIACLVTYLWLIWVSFKPRR